MPRPVGCIGETKLKILTIIFYKQSLSRPAYGYNVWETMRKEFHCYLSDASLRNVYRHLRDLQRLGLVTCRVEGSRGCGGASDRKLYELTAKGNMLKEKFENYLRVLSG